MADDRNNPNQSSNQNQQTPGRNPDENQRTSEREPGKDQGLGKGQEGNRELNEGGFEKGGQGKETTQT